MLIFFSCASLGETARLGDRVDRSSISSDEKKINDRNTYSAGRTAISRRLTNDLMVGMDKAKCFLD